MKDIKILEDILVDKTYLDKLLLELTLSKVKSRELVIGFLFELLIKHDMYGVTEESIIDNLRIFSTPEDVDLIDGYHKIFLEEVKSSIIDGKKENDVEMKLINKSLMLSNILNDQVRDIKDIENCEDFKRELRQCTKEEVDHFKSFLLKVEFYETIISVDKILNETTRS